MKTIIAIILLTASIAFGATTNIIYAPVVADYQPTCPCSFSRVQTAAYTKPAPTWGWYASNTLPCRVFVNDTNKICVEVIRADGMFWRGTNTVTFTPGKTYPCRFTLYFKYPAFTNSYPLTIVNFKP